MRHRVISGLVAATFAASVAVAGFVALPLSCGATLAEGWSSRVSADDRSAVSLAAMSALVLVGCVVGAFFAAEPSGRVGPRWRASLRTAAVAAGFAAAISAFGVYLVVALSGGWPHGACGGSEAWFVGVVLIAAPLVWVLAVVLWVAYWLSAPSRNARNEL